jgi:hypothetical protein
MFKRGHRTAVALAVAVFFAFGDSGHTASGQSNPVQAIADGGRTTQTTAAALLEAPVAKSKLPPFYASRTVPNEKAIRQYQLIWGIDNILVKQVASGSLVRFSYRVVDPNKARILNDEKLTPQLIDEASRAALQIPVMDKVGKLRQTATPESGREYWMVFSNKGGYVKPGNRVSVVIGNFQLHGLIVQ